MEYASFASQQPRAHTHSRRGIIAATDININNWAEIAAADPADQTAAAMVGLLRFKRGQLDRTTMVLLEDRAGPQDWVAMQYVCVCVCVFFGFF